MRDRLANGGAAALLVALASLWPLIGSAFLGATYGAQTWRLAAGVGLAAAVLCWVLLIGATFAEGGNRDAHSNL